MRQQGRGFRDASEPSSSAQQRHTTDFIRTAAETRSGSADNGYDQIPPPREGYMRLRAPDGSIHVLPTDASGASGYRAAWLWKNHETLSPNDQLDINDVALMLEGHLAHSTNGWTNLDARRMGFSGSADNGTVRYDQIPPPREGYMRLRAPDGSIHVLPTDTSDVSGDRATWLWKNHETSSRDDQLHMNDMLSMLEGRLAHTENGWTNLDARRMGFSGFA